MTLKMNIKRFHVRFFIAFLIYLERLFRFLQKPAELESFFLSVYRFLLSFIHLFIFPQLSKGIGMGYLAFFE